MRHILLGVVLLASSALLANEQRSELFSLPNDGECTALAFSADGKQLAVVVRKTDSRRKLEVVVWDLEQRKEQKRLPGHHASLCSVAFSPDGKLLAVGDQPAYNGVTLWDLSTAKPASILATESRVTSVAFSPDGILVAAGVASHQRDNSAHVLKVWEVASGREVHGARIVDSLAAGDSLVDFSPNGDLIAVGRNENVALWSTKTWADAGLLKLRESETHRPGCAGLKFFPDGKRLAVAQDQRVAIWSIAQAKRVRWATPATGDAPAERYHPRGMALSPDGNLVARGAFRGQAALGADTGRVGVWRTTTSLEVQTYQCPRGCFQIAFSPDGKLLAGGLSDGTVLVWDVTRPSSTQGKR